jgi:cation diffusion facilitator family transporter
MSNDVNPQTNMTAAAASSEKTSVAATSVLAAIFLTVSKVIVGVMTGSLGILAEAAHSLLDLVAAAITLLAVHVSDRPPDADHTYGHGKVENFSALVETLLLLITCAWIIYEAVQRLFFHAPEVDASVWGFLTVIASIVININRSGMLYAAARKHHSQALEADALHFYTDIWSSAVVLVGLGLVWLGQNLFPDFAGVLAKADAIAALGVAVIVLFVSWDLGKRTADVLMDRTPADMVDQLKAAASQVEGVLSVDQVRARRSGPSSFIDITVSVDRNLPFEHTHRMAEAVEAAVQQVTPGADVVVHTDPKENERETVADRARALAAHHHLAVHNIGIHDAGGLLYVDLHLEVDDHLSLRQAHDLSRHIEGDLRADNPAIAKVNTHIESRGTGIGNGEEITAAEPDIVQRIRQIADSIAGASSCHDVRLRRHGDQVVASLHCSFDDSLPIMQVHAISSRIEMALHESIPGLERVLVHTEPADAKPAA